jgi:2'-5' RNA ligase
MNPPKTIRAFLALYPDDAARAEMADVIETFRQTNATIKWERPKQVHITAKFLGDVPVGVLDELAGRLQSALQDFPAVRASIDSTGVFPNYRQPRIVWLGFSRPQSLLAAIQQAVEDCCLAVGIAKERQAWIPHFTIGRVKERSFTRDLENEIATCNFNPIPVKFGSLCIMESVLSPGGAVHTVRARIDLKGQASTP